MSSERPTIKSQVENKKNIINFSIGIWV